MNENFYKKIMRHFQTHPAYIYPLILVKRVLEISGFVLYPVLLFLPAFFFLAMSRIRKLINSPRPYEMYDILPLIPRDGQGQSFPSRHVFSIFLIGTLWCGVWLPVGILLILFGILLACIRVAAGVHFPKDVLWGAIFGIICGALTLLISTL